MYVCDCVMINYAILGGLRVDDVRIALSVVLDDIDFFGVG